MKFFGKNSRPPFTAEEGLCWATAAPVTISRNSTVSTRFMQAPGRSRFVSLFLGKRAEQRRSMQACAPRPIGIARHSTVGFAILIGRITRASTTRGSQVLRVWMGRRSGVGPLGLDDGRPHQGLHHDAVLFRLSLKRRQLFRSRLGRVDIEVHANRFEANRDLL